MHGFHRPSKMRFLIFRLGSTDHSQLISAAGQLQRPKVRKTKIIWSCSFYLGLDWITLWWLWLWWLDCENICPRAFVAQPVFCFVVLGAGGREGGGDCRGQFQSAVFPDQMLPLPGIRDNTKQNIRKYLILDMLFRHKILFFQDNYLGSPDIRKFGKVGVVCTCQRLKIQSQDNFQDAIFKTDFSSELDSRF